MKLMGIDYGRRRIGVAVTDETAAAVRSVGCIEARGSAQAAELLRAMIAREAPGALVFGLPLGPDEEETAMSREVRVFARALSGSIGIDARFVEESFSSVEAQRLARHRRRKTRRTKAVIDRIAACLILEQYLKENA
jgi:putative holliday junction resolvase